ncbi:MAG: hypothetical protein KDE01_14860, partial [Caldilineaceae bacterium]|nr:hypothetical protein [Caldilineaceae bacterium]
GAWTTWNTFPGTTTSADFDYASLTLGDGLYEFFAIATNNLGQRQPFNPDSGTGASVILDLGGEIQVEFFMPIISNQMPD